MTAETLLREAGNVSLADAPEHIAMLYEQIASLKRTITEVSADKQTLTTLLEEAKSHIRDSTEPDYSLAREAFIEQIAFWPPEWVNDLAMFSKMLDAVLAAAFDDDAADTDEDPSDYNDD